MKKAWLAISILGFSVFFSPGFASAVDMGSAAGVKEPVDKHVMEGWITRVDYRSSQFRLLDPRGFQRQVTTKPGTIGDYRLGDHVRVEIDPDYKRARLIEKIG